MVKSSLRSVREADIAIIMIDGSEGHIADQDLKLLFYAYEEKKSIILVVNKTDILEEEKKDRLLYDFKRYEFLIKKIPVVWISCKIEKNIGKLLKEVQKARTRRTQKFDEEEINELIKTSLIRRPLYHKRQLLKIMNVKNLSEQRGLPTFVLYVNFPSWFGPTQLGYMENQLRRKYDLLGCPVVFITQKV
jgi:GTP-binding protein